jgi:hypothetical protein
MKSIPLLTLALALSLTGCLLESVAPIDRSIRPYGAHWIKEGMTRESRLRDFSECGGDSVTLKAGYERQRGQTTADYFEGLNKHTLIVHSCMRASGYTYLEQCDARCMHP